MHQETVDKGKYTSSQRLSREYGFHLVHLQKPVIMTLNLKKSKKKKTKIIVTVANPLYFVTTQRKEQFCSQEEASCYLYQSVSKSQRSPPKEMEGTRWLEQTEAWKQFSCHSKLFVIAARILRFN